MILALVVLAACGVAGPPEGTTAVDMAEFWRVRR